MSRPQHFTPDAGFPFRTACGVGRSRLGRRARWRSVYTTPVRASVTCPACLRAMRRTETEAQALARGLRDGTVRVDW